jgi:hypothetical protein
VTELQRDSEVKPGSDKFIALLPPTKGRMKSEQKDILGRMNIELPFLASNTPISI